MFDKTQASIIILIIALFGIFFLFFVPTEKCSYPPGCICDNSGPMGSPSSYCCLNYECIAKPLFYHWTKKSKDTIPNEKNIFPQRSNTEPIKTNKSSDEIETKIIEANNETTSNKQENIYTNKLTDKEKKEIKNSFIEYIKNIPSFSDYYTDKELLVNVHYNTGKHIKGIILIAGIKNYSSPYFLAVKNEGSWKVIFNGQDIPLCSTVNPYNFPSNIVLKCWDNDKNKLIEFENK